MDEKMNFNPADLGPLRTESLASRPSLVDIEKAAKLTGKGARVEELVDSLPSVLAAESFRLLVGEIVSARGKGRPVVISMGAHVIKCGLSPLIVDLLERGIISAVATNGACAVHDYELAACGKTSEDVAKRLPDGSFGNTADTARSLDEAARNGGESGFGMALGRLIEDKKLPNAKTSIYAAAARLGLPCTIHVAIGTDVVHMHPGMDAAALGKATHADFRLLVSVISELEGGVFMNFGSAVLLPEVFLKALSAARNLGAKVADFTTADFDMIRHYRPTQNVVSRPGGRGLSFTGHHEIMLPLLRQAVIDRL